MEDKETVSDETTVLECMAAGSPKPKLVWTKDGGPLVATERHFFTADNQLLIVVHTKVSDAGRYECEMSNPLGTERDSSMLTVMGASHMGGAGLDDDSATIGIIIIAVVCCVVGTSVVWVIIIYQTRKRARNAPVSAGAASSGPTVGAAPSGAPFPGVEFIQAETDDPDINLDLEAHHLPTTILYPPDLEILAYKGASSSAQQLYTYLADNNSDSEQSSGKDSGTGDSARRSNSNDDVTVMMADALVGHSLHSLSTPPDSEISTTDASALPVIRSNPPRGRFHNYTRTLSTFVPQPALQQRPLVLSEVDDASGRAAAAARVSLYEERRPRSSRNSAVGSPVTNYSLARNEIWRSSTSRTDPSPCDIPGAPGRAAAVPN